MKNLFEKYYHKVVYILLGGLQIKVVVIDIKMAYGKPRFQVSPVEGKGEIWVESISMA